jgi:hypothetical protein
MNEHALFHRRSRTLVVADLFFSFPEETSGWPRFFMRHVMRLPRLFGISFFYRRLIIRDKLAFERSMHTLLDLDFERNDRGALETARDGRQTRRRASADESRH